MTISFIHTSLVLTRDVIIISLCLSWLKFPILLQVPLIWKSLPLREWDILFTLSLLLLLFISLTILLLERISQHLELVCEVKVSHVTVSNWCKRFAPALLNAASPYKKQLSLLWSQMNGTLMKLTSKLMAKTIDVWFALDFETRVILDFHISEYRDSTAASYFVKQLQWTILVNLEKLWLWIATMLIESLLKRFFPNTDFIQVECFDDHY